MSILTSEVKDIMSKKHVLYDVAERVEYKRELNAEQKEISEVMDQWCKD